MQVVTWVGVSLLCAGLGAVTSLASDQVSISKQLSESAGATTKSNVSANNTKENKRDRENATLTPGDQGNDTVDLDITAKIRREVVHNKQLSTTAKNIKIITVNGKVTLRGPVKSAQERSIINGIVQKVGPSSLDNQLEVEKQ